MMEKRVTIADLAKILGIDKSSISLALRDSPKMSLATRARVQRAARCYGTLSPIGSGDSVYAGAGVCGDYFLLGVKRAVGLAVARGSGDGVGGNSCGRIAWAACGTGIAGADGGKCVVTMRRAMNADSIEERFLDFARNDNRLSLRKARCSSLRRPGRT